MNKTSFLSGVIMLSMFYTCLAVDDSMSVQQKLADANNAFGLELYQKLCSKEGNLFISPYSISSALAMTWAGARGDTAREMDAVLRFDMKMFDAHEGFFHLNKGFESVKAVEMSIANSLWPAQKFILEKTYLQLMKEKYGVEVTAMNYATATEESRQQINAWVETETREKIQNLITPGALDPATMLVLVNAIYFKGDWAAQFDPEKTIDGPFTTVNGDQQTVPLMRQKKEFRYAETENVKLLEMPYTGDRLAMTLILPRNTKSLESIEKILTPEKLAGWLKQMHKVKVDVTLPKFKMEWGSTDISQALKTMGMNRAFSGKADFTGITKVGGIYISMVLHKTFIEVNEEGSEAAAATAVIMRKTSMPRRLEFKADHPFIFMIRDTETGAILFLGRVLTPLTPLPRWLRRGGSDLMNMTKIIPFPITPQLWNKVKKEDHPFPHSTAMGRG
ncbi:serpin family protein [bacterium]|nr:serpin family protein [bacterium]